MKVGIVGLGKMGLNLAYNLRDNGYEVAGVDLLESAREEAKKEGIEVFESESHLLNFFKNERKIIWLMVPSGDITEMALEKLKSELTKGDLVIEGGNSNYKDSVKRSNAFKELEIDYLDVGTSGGISGARNSACLMIGGKKEVFEQVENLFRDISIENGYLYAGESGAGHFLKMVHNGVEYGMMQAIGEGFQIVEKSDYEFDLESVARVWNNGSVVRSWLMELAEESFKESPRLEEYRGVVAASGEAKWTVETALDMEVAVPVIALSLMIRNLSQEEDSFSAKVVAALRSGFGGHSFTEFEA